MSWNNLSQSPGQSKTQRITLLALGLVVLGTVFLLPRFVSEPWVAGDPDEPPTPPVASTSEIAPSTAAEKSRYRQESQSVLAEIVATRDRLTEKNVDRWAGAEFQQALQTIESGDELYGYGEYQASLERFGEALTALSHIEELGDRKLAEAKAAGAAAIESLNPNVAAGSIELAGAIAPDDPEVQELSARVASLEQVADLIVAGDEALDAGRYEAALQAYRQALELDPSHQRAAESVAVAQSELTASRFRRQMSLGFAALEQQDYDAARSSFEAAGRIYPADPAVARALAQVENRESATFASRDLERAASLEANEEWSEAVAVYESLLAADPSLTDAKARLIPARVRADLDKRLNRYIGEPLRLSSEADYRRAQLALTDAQGIKPAGTRLSLQIGQLKELLERAATPVNVVFQSDNQTHVVLFRVAELGRFERTSLRLRPGRYVAAGTRQGFRDVRVEFTITGESQQETVVVRCEEPIG